MYFSYSERIGRPACVVLAVLLGAGLTCRAQIVPAIRLAPAAPSAPAPAPTQPVAQPPPSQPDAQATPTAAGTPAPQSFTPQELERLRATYDALSDLEKDEMLGAYEGMGIDLAAILGLKQVVPEAPQRGIVDAVRALDFARKPEAVLAARSQLGFGASLIPARESTEALAKWLHTNILAGEWQVLDLVLGQLKPDEATGVYSHILRSTNEGTQTLLPEEVLALGDLCPGDMADWQLDVLAQLLKNSAKRYGKGPFLARIKEGTRLFGGTTEVSRARTVRLLVGGDLALDAYEFLPPLDEARTAANAREIYAHARYHEELAAAAGAGESAEDQRRQAWTLLCEASMISTAEVPLRKEAMTRAIDMLPEMPPAQATQWLSTVFADGALGPAALEVVALRAMAFHDQKADAAVRAQGLATMKAAIAPLLARPDLNTEALRVPLRMLTTALADEIDVVVKEKGELRGVARETDLLYRAAPDDRWLGAIEPSVAIRGYRASIAIATIADETDSALDVLAGAARRFPDQALDFADGFLKLWENRLNPKARPGEEDYPYMFYYGMQRVPTAPLTRGRQQRNLEILERLLAILDGLGIPGRTLPSVTQVFKSCHARTEVFDRDEITRVFGAIDTLAASTAAELAESMRTGLGGDWRNRQVQRSFGMMRSQAEIGDLVDVGYELAIELASRAAVLDPDSWRHAVLNAALSYDRVQFKQTQQKDDFTKYNEYRRQAFTAFEQASAQYASLVSRGLERDNSGVYVQWFLAVVDAGQPVPDDKDAVKADDALSDDQIDRIGAAMKALPENAYDRHVGGFAREVVDALPSAPPERKPAIVRSAARIVADHPAGAPLRRLNELYQDLLKNEIRLRMTVDGADSVSSGRLFGASLTLRYTNSVDRETGGFDKYLQQETYVRIGNQYRQMNYQGQIKRGIETALGTSFDIESIGFFEPLTPSRAVKEDGQSGWQEKPLAYILLKAKDPSVDRIPQASFDMHFDDTTGAVTLPIVSNSPPIDATKAESPAPPARPLMNLVVDQVVDARRLIAGTEDRAVTLEVHAKGDGVIPEVRDLLQSLDDALPGYHIAENGIEARPYTVIQIGETRNRYWYGPAAPDEEKTYPKADESGIFRLSTERSWTITYKPAGGAVGGQFTLPTLRTGMEGALTSRHYADMDIVKVDGAAVAVTPRWSTWSKAGVAAAAVLVVAGGAWFLLRKRKPKALAEGELVLPARITPLNTIAILQRIGQTREALDPQQRESLQGDIRLVEHAFFGPQNGAAATPPNEDDMREMLRRWSSATRT